MVAGIGLFVAAFVAFAFLKVRHKHKEVVVPVQRGPAERVALHGTTLICLEALVLGLAASATDQAVATLERLNELRQSVSGTTLDLA